jgi:soluble lytic murein transglycosylase
MLALARQESEMNPAAFSHANARGLMQFIPSTAKSEARRQGLPYRASWLTDDPGYNMTLGGAHLDTLLGQFNGSYIMTAAAYNAGASRPNRWIGEYGDPRAGEVDPIDWVEFIPFSETRNYVQRVLENTQVYRHRLSGEPEEIQLSDDLKRGRF